MRASSRALSETYGTSPMTESSLPPYGV